jgi:hypothetical protein
VNQQNNKAKPNDGMLNKFLIQYNLQYLQYELQHVCFLFCKLFIAPLIFSDSMLVVFCLDLLDM